MECSDTDVMRIVPEYQRHNHVAFEIDCIGRKQIAVVNMNLIKTRSSLRWRPMFFFCVSCKRNKEINNFI